MLKIIEHDLFWLFSVTVAPSGTHFTCFLVEPAGFIGSATGFSGVKFVHLFESFVQSTVVAPTTLRFREVSIHPPPEDGAAK